MLFSNGVTVDSAGVQLRDTSKTYKTSLINAESSQLADAVISVDAGSSDRAFGLQADLTVTADCTLDQDVQQSASPTFVTITSSQSTGTAPLTVSSTTKVANLHVDKLDNCDVNDSGSSTADLWTASKILAEFESQFDGRDYQADVLDTQTDNTLDPGASPTTGDRYILTDTANLHANFGSITGVGDNDIVEYDGTDFVVSYDVSAKGAGALAYDIDLGNFLRWNGTAWSEFAGGQTNTGSNVGTDGVGVFDAKVSADLQFRNIAPASSRVTVTLNSKDIDIDVDESALDLANIGGTLAVASGGTGATTASGARGNLEVAFGKRDSLTANGSTTSFPITHNANTRNLVGLVTMKASGADAVAIVEFQPTSANAGNLVFQTAPTTSDGPGADGTLPYVLIGG